MPFPIFGLSLSEATLADRLDEAGYVADLIGKWHLWYRPTLHPLRRGFDEILRLFGRRPPLPASPGSGADSSRDHARLGKRIPHRSLRPQSGGFHRKTQTGAFFHRISVNAVHPPLEATPRYLQPFSAITDERRRTLVPMLSAMEEAVGRVMTALRVHQLDDDTLVIFISDNGGPTRNGTSRNDHSRGFKGQVLEGGIRVPFMMWCKGRLPRGGTTLTIGSSASPNVFVTPAAKWRRLARVPSTAGM